MELSAQLFSQIAARAGADPSQRTKHEKRRADRLAMRLQVRITPSADPLGMDASASRSVLSTIRDLSPRGVSLEYLLPMPRESQFLLHLVGQTGQPAVHLLCSVAHCNRSPKDDCYVIGAEFTCVQEAPRESKPDISERDRIQQSILG